MTDLEITRLCAEAMGWKTKVIEPHGIYAQIKPEFDWGHYRPLDDDAQALALVKKFHLQIGKTLRTPEEPFGLWVVSRTSKADATGPDLNRAICECVANIPAAKA